jgi:hypothetical protein
MKTILISGGNGKFAKALINANTKFNILAPKKSQMNIQKISSIMNYIKKKKLTISYMLLLFPHQWPHTRLKLKKVLPLM